MQRVSIPVPFTPVLVAVLGLASGIQPGEVEAQTAARSIEAADLARRGDSLFWAHHFHQAIPLLERAIEIEPDNAELYEPLTKSYAYLGMFDAAERRTQALYFGRSDHPRLDVDFLESAGHCRMALFRTMQEDREGTLAHVDSMLALADPDRRYPSAKACAIRFEARWGALDRAAEHLEWVLEGGSRIARLEFLPWAVHVARQRGEDARVQRLLTEARKIAATLGPGRLEVDDSAQHLPKSGVPPHRLHHWRADVEALAGETDAAIASLRRAVEAGSRAYYWWKHVDPMLDALRDEARYQALLAELASEVDFLRVETMMRLQARIPLPEPVALVDVTVVDGTGAAPLPNRTVVIRGGRIEAILDTRTEEPPSDARVMDLPGRYVVPGLIEAHFHLAMARVAPNEQPRRAYERLLEKMLRRGITTVRDMAGDARILAGLARDARVGDLVAPDLHFAALLAQPDFFVRDARPAVAGRGAVAGEVPWLRAVTSETDLERAVAEARGTGATGLKLYDNLAPDLVARITEEAHRQGLQVWAHSQLLPSSRPGDLVEAGADALSHVLGIFTGSVDSVPAGYSHRASFTKLLERVKDVENPEEVVDQPPFPSLFERMAEKGTVLDATAGVYWRSPPGFFPSGTLPLACALVRAARDQAVPVAAGSDSGRLLLHDEIEGLVEKCGFTPLEEIRSATLQGAMAIGRSDRSGSIAAGKRADLVVLGSDPTQDVANLRDVELVMKRGRTYEPESPDSVGRTDDRPR